MPTATRYTHTFVIMYSSGLPPSLALSGCCSADGVPNRSGQVFTFSEFKRLLKTPWDPEGAFLFPEFLVRRFIAYSFLLGALRSVQMERFRLAGLRNCSHYRDHRDVNNFNRPMVKSVYTKPQRGQERQREQGR